MSPNDISAQPDIVIALERLTNQSPPITLTTTFDGLLLKQDIQVLSVSQDTAQFQAGDLKIIAASGGGNIHLHHGDFSWPVRARLHTCDLPTSTFTLSDLSWAHTGWQERSQERVQPKTPTYVTVRSPAWTLAGAVLDVDAAGLGVLVKSCGPPGSGLRPGSRIQLDLAIQFPLHPPGRPFRGTLVHSEPIRAAFIRVGIRFQRNPQQVRFFKAYTSQRKKEILEEIDRAYFKSLGPRRVEDLYF